MGPRTAMYAQKRIISCPYWESYPSILVSFIQAIEKILQSLNYFKSPDLLGGGGDRTHIYHTHLHRISYWRSCVCFMAA